MRPNGLKILLVGLGLLFLSDCGGGGAAAKATPPPPSGTPQHLQAFVDNDGSVLVTWEAPPTGAESYDLQAQVAQSNFSRVNSTGIPATGQYMSFRTTLESLGAPELAEVGFRVLAYKGTATPDVSAVVVVKAPLLRPSVALSTSQDGVQRLTLINNSKVADHLQLERFHSFDLNLLVWETTSLGELPVGTASYVDATPPEGSTVKYAVRYSKGSDSVSNTSNMCAAAYRPPSDLTTIVAGQEVTLSWVNHSAAATKIVIRRGGGLNPDAAGNELITLSPGAHTWVDTVPTPGFYTYSVEARTNLWSSVPTSPVMVVTLPPSNGLALTSSLLQMPVARQALRGDSGAWYFAQEMHDGHPEVYLPAGSGWNSTTPTAEGQLVAPYLALDPLERPHTVFLQGSTYGTPKTILHGWHDGASWQTEEVASRVINTDLGITWRLDTSGVPHLLWAKGDYTQPQALEYASRNQDGTWSIEPVTMTLPDQTFHAASFQLFIDETGTPHFLIADIFTVYHVMRAGPGAWTWENLGDLGQGRLFKLQAHAGFGQGPADFTLFLLRIAPGTSDTELCLLTKTGGNWQAPVPVSQMNDSVPFNWARSRTNGRMAFYFYAPEGTKVVVGANGFWTTHILNPVPCSDAFPAFDPLGHLHLLCQVSQMAIGSQVISLNVLYDELP